ncbi:DUF421 domain-containing protein [Galbibacter sp. BG1]|uniref:DUF421 domain-containing protein n=1 Tax=Galbibacter sp. BG1 TaxID=1170699 RepID=UPI0015BA7676|nr:YetF domain-containing protein [Galbibacter sp. BG1]QLE02841.1 DUF421 domain-containing protein [Galbibacter sp. BG1]
MDLSLFDLKWDSIVNISITATGIYIAVIAYTRIFGKRSFSKMSSFDFAMTVAVGSIIATTILSSTVSMMEGIIGLGMTYVLQLSAAVLRRYKIFKNAIDNTPLLLMYKDKILHNNLKKARVSEEDLRAKLREANVLRLEDVKAVIFETTGSISVLHTTDDDVHLNPWLLDDVNRT